MAEERRQEQKRLTLRIDAELDRRIEEAARELGLSKNAYIKMVLYKNYKSAS